MHEWSKVEQLLTDIAQGNTRAFSELYDCTSTKLYGICLRVLEDDASAQEVLQETYMKVWRNAERYQSNGLSPMTWLMTIARNSAIDKRRALMAQPSMSSEDIELIEDHDSPECQVAFAQAKQHIEDCLNSLPPERAEAIKGAYLEGLSYAELAEQCAIPLNTIRTWLRRGLQRLKGCLEQ
ncbi:sigma-70 family RNA polymerase sigma factor [Marinomonas ostreistagni]|uniref:sigma-70 family RNA polymerase sigma factor n=1 Tax=Marinomonas ostreistagni TaxID=359209 RepID=UPI001951014D|nr:sigma-70 family RNA polymerase sigma factor [Marinomonas ostreistagni]MBM6551707.1 sigma-70 family RNA polymerase sigma factor [Marinomonas ostreistagni]